MTAPHDLDRQLQAFLQEGPTDLPDPSFDAVRDHVEVTRQRAVIGPWRMPTVNKLVPLGIGAAAVVVVLVGGAQLLRPPAQNGVVGAPSTPVPTVAPTPNPTPVPTATPAAPTPSSPSAPPLAQGFTSTKHGISLSYPEGWTAKAATKPWAPGTDLVPGFLDPQARADFLYDTTERDSLFLAIGSQPIGDTTPEDWIMEMGGSGDNCAVTEPITVGGASGRIGSGDTCHLALVTTDGRGYWISLYRGGDHPAAIAPYDRAWFEEVLATVQLHPEDAVD